MQAKVMSMIDVIEGGRDAVSRRGRNREHKDAQRETGRKNRTQPARRETHMGKVLSSQGVHKEVPQCYTNNAMKFADDALSKGFNLVGASSH